MRKWGAIVVCLGLTAGALAFAATPLLSLRSLRTGIEGREPKTVARFVDFPTLHANVQASAHKKIERENDGTLLEPLSNLIYEFLADSTLEKVSTPEGLIRVACDQKLDGDLSQTRGKPCKIGGKLLGADYLARDRFRVDVQAPDGKKIALILSRRSWIDWRVVDVRETGTAA